MRLLGRLSLQTRLWIGALLALALATASLSLVLAGTYNRQVTALAQDRLQRDATLLRAQLDEYRLRDLRLVQIIGGEPAVATAADQHDSSSLDRQLGTFRAEMPGVGTILAVVDASGKTISTDPFADLTYTNDVPVRAALQNARDTNPQTTRNALIRLNPAFPALSIESAWPLRAGNRTVGAVVLLNALGDVDFNGFLGSSDLQGGIVAPQPRTLLAGSTALRQLQQQQKLAPLLGSLDDNGTVVREQLPGIPHFYMLGQDLPATPANARLVLAVNGGDLATTVATLQRQMLGMAAITFVILAALSWLAVRLALRSVRRLQAVVDAVDQAEQPAALPAHAPPELRSAADALVSMAARLAAAEHAEQGQRSHVEAIIDSMVDGVVISDADRRVTLVNPVAKRLLGIHGAEPGATLLPIEAAVADSKMIKSRSAPIIAADGRTTGYVTLLHDASQEAELERLKSEFVGTVSHELRTPLTSIKGSVDLLLDDETGALNATQRRFLNTIRRSSERLIGIVSDLLDLSRLEAGRVQLDPHPVDLLHLAEDVVGSLGNLFGAKRQLVEARGAPDLLPALADRQRVEQVLVNLLGNASKYTPEGGRVCVAVEPAPALADGSPAIRLSVTDSGPGLSPADQQRVFDKFYRAGDGLGQAQQTGTGLGLTIARSLVELHGGTLTVRSELGQGSTFTICLPAYSGEE